MVIDAWHVTATAGGAVVRWVAATVGDGRCVTTTACDGRCVTTTVGETRWVTRTVACVVAAAVRRGVTTAACSDGEAVTEERVGAADRVEGAALDTAAATAAGAEELTDVEVLVLSMEGAAC